MRTCSPRCSRPCSTRRPPASSTTRRAEAGVRSGGCGRRCRADFAPRWRTPCPRRRPSTSPLASRCAASTGRRREPSPTRPRTRATSASTWPAANVMASSSPPTPIEGRTATTNNRAPSPPIHCVPARQNNVARDSASGFSTTVAAVVVNPATDSKTESSQFANVPRNSYVAIDTRITADHAAKTPTNAVVDRSRSGTRHWCASPPPTKAQSNASDANSGTCRPSVRTPRTAAPTASAPHARTASPTTNPTGDSQRPARTTRAVQRSGPCNSGSCSVAREARSIGAAGLPLSRTRDGRRRPSRASRTTPRGRGHATRSAHERSGPCRHGRTRRRARPWAAGVRRRSRRRPGCPP